MFPGVLSIADSAGYYPLHIISQQGPYREAEVEAFRLVCRARPEVSSMLVLPQKKTALHRMLSECFADKE